jgi:hypothetical protein
MSKGGRIEELKLEKPFDGGRGAARGSQFDSNRDKPNKTRLD